MEFKKCAVGNKIWGEPQQDNEMDRLQITYDEPGMIFSSRDAIKKLITTEQEQMNRLRAKALEKFFVCMAVNHSAMVEGTDKSNFKYASQSPDELALILGAKSVGVIYSQRTAKVITITVGEQRRDYEILHEIPFDSDRKRMSLILKYQNEYLCFTKGADSVILPLLDLTMTELETGSKKSQGSTVQKKMAKIQ